MSLKNNPYDKLLQYLIEEDKIKKVTPVKESKAKKDENSELSDTKKLIEESKIHSYIPGETFEHPPPKKSECFNVSKFETMMRTKLIEEYKKLQSYERPYISVSELTTCIRKCYYNRMKYPVNMKKLFTFSYLYIIQKVGDTIHSIIQDLYGFSETEKTVISERFKVKGRVDGIQDQCLYEIKSIDAEKFKNQYIKDHYIQAVIYAYILNHEYNYKISKITIIYVIRNLKRIVPFDLPLDDKLAESLLSKAPILRSCLDNLTIPEPFGSTKEQCKYCLYLEQCKKDKPSEVIQAFNRKKQPKNKKEKDVPQKKQDDRKSAFLL